MSKQRRLLYRLIWGTTLLALVGKWKALPALFRFLSWAVAVLVNGPGTVVIGQTWGYLYVRSPIGHLAAAVITMLAIEPLLRWLERPLPDQAAVSRRAFLLGGAALAGTAAVSGYSFLVERKNYQLRSYRLYLADLPAELEGLRVAVIADLHCGPVNRPGDLRPALQMVNQCQPDLILLPGDFVHLSSRYFAEAAELLASLRPRLPDGLMLTWGNHDHWNGIEVARQQLGRWLLDRPRLLQPDRTFASQGKRGLWLAGVDDLWEGKPDPAAALQSLPLNQPRLLLAHNPDTAEIHQARRLDLMLCGHTHGGQVRLPGLGFPIVPSNYGQKYAGGFVDGPFYPVYITRGLGVGGVPIRLGVRPEVTLFELYSSQRGTRWT